MAEVQNNYAEYIFVDGAWEQLGGEENTPTAIVLDAATEEEETILHIMV